MNLDYVSKIKFGLKRYKTIATDKATSRVLDGSYNSIYKGRSMNFDELREYVPGDDIKDIDWKATSRSQKVLIRQWMPTGECSPRPKQAKRKARLPLWRAAH